MPIATPIHIPFRFPMWGKLMYARTTDGAAAPGSLGQGSRQSGQPAFFCTTSVTIDLCNYSRHNVRRTCSAWAGAPWILLATTACIWHAHGHVGSFLLARTVGLDGHGVTVTVVMHGLR